MFIFNQPRALFSSWRRDDLPTDLLAGLTVAAIAIPQSMAYTTLAGVPVSVGLYTALVSMIVYALYTSSRRVIVGPDTAMSIMAGVAIAPFVVGKPELAGFYVMVLAGIVGVLHIIGSQLKLYYIAEFLSRPILLGYLVGVALVIMSDQIPKMLGLSVGGENVWYNLLGIVRGWELINPATVLLSLGLIVVGLVLRKLAPKIPTAIVLLVLATVASAVLDFSQFNIATVGNVPAGLPKRVVPSVNWDTIKELLLPAVAIALVSYADTIATARSFAAKAREDVSSEVELTSLGLANLAMVPVGGMPVSASGSRTVVNDSMGARSQFAQIYGALVIALVLVLFSSYLRYIPKAALAVIIVLSAYKLFDFDELDAIWRGWRSEAALAIVTALGVSILGILQGIGLAIALAVLDLIRRSAFPHDAILGVSEDGMTFRDSSRPPKTYDTPGLIIYRFDAPLFFGNANYFHDRVKKLVSKSYEPVRWFLLDAEAISSIDSTGAKMLKSLLFELEEMGIVFATARVKGPIRDTLRKTGLGARLENRPRFASIGKAYEAYCERYDVPSRRQYMIIHVKKPLKRQSQRTKAAAK